MTFKDYHHQVKQKIEQELALFFDEQKTKAEQKDQVLVDMVEVLREFVMRGGKRVGPLMTVLAYEYAKSLALDAEQASPHLSGAGALESSPDGRGANIFRLACAVEMHHLYLLNLDDMADRDVVRHGGPTLDQYYQHQIFSKWKDSDHHGRTFSSIAGALLNSYTFELITTSGFSPEVIAGAIQVVTDSLFSDTVVGWQIQYFQNNQPLAEASEEQFLKGLEYVTSRYKFVGPMRVGVIAASYLFQPSPHLSGAGALESSPDGRSDAAFGREDIATAFDSYGKHVGIAFQLQDDVMGLFGDPKEMGKAVGNDVREGKKTLLLQRAYRNSTPEDQKFLEDVCGRELQEGELERVQKIVKETGSLEYSIELAKQHVADALSSLESLPVQNVYTEIMKELARYMIERKK